MSRLSKYLHPRDEIMQTMERIYRYRMTTTSGGNLSNPESYLLLRDVGRVPYGVQFRDPEGLARQVSLRSPIALLENDGVLVVGASVLEAFDRLEVLESTSEALVNSRLIGEVAPMSEEVIDDLKRAFASMLA